MGDVLDFTIVRLRAMIRLAEEDGSTAARYFRKILKNYEQGTIEVHWIDGRIRVEKKVGDNPPDKTAKTSK